jgi:monoamine oxidase
MKVIVVGGGIAGLSAGVALRRAEHQVQVSSIEPLSYTRLCARESTSSVEPAHCVSGSGSWKRRKRIVDRSSHLNDWKFTH